MKLLSVSTVAAILMANQALAAATGPRESMASRSDKKIAKRCPSPDTPDSKPAKPAAAAAYVPDQKTEAQTAPSPVAAYVPDQAAQAPMAAPAAETTTPKPTTTEDASTDAVQKTSGGGGGAGHHVIYSDKLLPNNMIPEAAYIGGFNRFILAFYLSDGRKAFDNAKVWEDLAPEEKKKTIEAYHAAGIQVMVSAFGATGTPTTDGIDAKAFAKEVSDWVIANELDGVDCDYEDVQALDAGTSTAWLIDFTTALREALPDKLISHAPMAAWFATTFTSEGNYGNVHNAVGDMIDFYNLQYYNSDTYLDCKTMVSDASGTPWPGSSLKELNAFGIPWEKLVLGKPIDPTAANNGYMEPGEVGSCIKEVVALGGTTNVMYWEMKAGVDHADAISKVLGA